MTVHAMTPALCADCLETVLDAAKKHTGSKKQVLLYRCPHHETLVQAIVGDQGRIQHWALDSPVTFEEAMSRAEQLKKSGPVRFDYGSEVLN